MALNTCVAVCLCVDSAEPGTLRPGCQGGKVIAIEVAEHTGAPCQPALTPALASQQHFISVGSNWGHMAGQGLEETAPS